MTESKRIPARATMPGVFIRDELRARHWAISKLAHNADVPDHRFTGVLVGSERIDGYLAEGLSRAFGMSKEFWLNLQNNYDEWLAAKEASR